MNITDKELEQMRKDYRKKETQQVVSRAVAFNGIDGSSENNTLLTTDQFQFSIDVDSEVPANQQQSGRCWMFATLNTIRWHIEKNLKLPKGSFELSQAYNAFYNKMERANWFLTRTIQTAEKPLDDAEVIWLLTNAMQDGGDFPMMIDLVKKYGVIPHTAMPETACTNNTAKLNDILSKLLRKDALILRSMVAESASKAELNQKQKEMLNEVYRVLCVAMGEPPQTFNFEYRDTRGKYHADFNITPQEFVKKYVPINLEDYLGVCNIPETMVPFGRAFGVEDSNEIVDGEPNRYLNVPMEELKRCAIEQLKAGEPVWFGCDVLQMSDFQKGMLSLDLYDYNKLFDIDLDLTKDERYQMSISGPTHAMTLAGVDLDKDGKPIRWKVENSWGTKAHGKPVGHGGYFIMDDAWFDQYMFEVAVRKGLIDKKYRDGMNQEPIILPYWNIFNPVEG